MRPVFCGREGLQKRVEHCISFNQDRVLVVVVLRYSSLGRETASRGQTALAVEKPTTLQVMAE
jgi:hypothetical protein